MLSSIRYRLRCTYYRYTPIHCEPLPRFVKTCRNFTGDPVHGSLPIFRLYRTKINLIPSYARKSVRESLLVLYRFGTWPAPHERIRPHLFLKKSACRITFRPARVTQYVYRSTGMGIITRCSDDPPRHVADYCSGVESFTLKVRRGSDLGFNTDS